MQRLSLDSLAVSERTALLAAVAVSRNAYAPYSGFHVGAVVVAGEREFAACNVENASFGLTICAERAAVAMAVAAGVRSFDLLALHTPTPDHTMPCGSCRQVLHEFGPGLRIVIGCADSEVVVTTAADLLPAGFSLERGSS